MKKIIVNADDFGLTKEISDRIIKIYKKGNLSSTSLMVNTPATDYAINLAKKNKGLGVGLHLNLTEGRSILGKSTLTNSQGFFLNKFQINSRVLLNKIKCSDIKDELEAQYNYLNNKGLILTHIDSHQHIHMNPKIFKVIANFAKSKSLKIRIAFPHKIKRKKGKYNLKKLLKQFVLYFASIANARYAKKISLKFNLSFNSIFDFHPFQLPTEADYYQLARLAKSNIHELMVHPYDITDELKEIYGNQNKKKFKFFKITNAEKIILMKKQIFTNFNLITYGDF